MEKMVELKNYISEHTQEITMKQIKEMVREVYKDMDTPLEIEWYYTDMLSYYIICCEVENIPPVSGY